jgi:hypothetical protein
VLRDEGEGIEKEENRKLDAGWRAAVSPVREATSVGHMLHFEGVLKLPKAVVVLVRCLI